MDHERAASQSHRVNAFTNFRVCLSLIGIAQGATLLWFVVIGCVVARKDQPVALPA